MNLSKLKFKTLVVGNSVNQHHSNADSRRQEIADKLKKCLQTSTLMLYTAHILRLTCM